MESSLSLSKQPFMMVINGTSSVGKTTVAKLLLEKLDKENLHSVGIDVFVNMLPSYLVGENIEARVGFYFSKKGGVVEIEVGQKGHVIVKRMHEFIKQLLNSGSSVIVDHVLLCDSWMRELEDFASEKVRVLQVLITCNSEEIKKRENSRGDRIRGLGEGLKYVENTVKKYDLIIDNTLLTPEETSNKIADYLVKKGFCAMRKV